jgi:predicted O-methyltransferase YrrM
MVIRTGSQCTVTKSTHHAERKQYEAAFERARAIQYPELDRFEQLAGFAVDRERLEAAARVLQCPIKANAPNWQHGRVLYTLARQYIAWAAAPTTFLDIGTAKGFSACVLSWAIADAGVSGHRIVSLDIVPPDLLVARNSIVECDKLMTVQQFVEPFIAPNVDVKFYGGGSAQWLNATPQDLHVGFAFVDGKHTFDAVTFEALCISRRQIRGDVIMFDDAQITPVYEATKQLRRYYRRDVIYLESARRGYCVAVKC